MALPPGPVWIAVSSMALSVVNSGMPSFPRGQRVCAASCYYQNVLFPVEGSRTARGDPGYNTHRGKTHPSRGCPQKQHKLSFPSSPGGSPSSCGRRSGLEC